MVALPGDIVRDQVTELRNRACGIHPRRTRASSRTQNARQTSGGRISVRQPVYAASQIVRLIVTFILPHLPTVLRAERDARPVI